MGEPLEFGKSMQQIQRQDDSVCFCGSCGVTSEIVLRNQQRILIAFRKIATGVAVEKKNVMSIINNYSSRFWALDNIIGGFFSWISKHVETKTAPPPLSGRQHFPPCSQRQQGQRSGLWFIFRWSALTRHRLSRISGIETSGCGNGHDWLYFMVERPPMFGMQMHHIRLRNSRQPTPEGLLKQHLYRLQVVCIDHIAGAGELKSIRIH